MTLHIKRVVAAMSAILMLLTLVPTAVLPTIQLPALSEQSVETTVPADDAAPTQTPDAPANDADAAPVTTPDASANAPSAPLTDADANNTDAVTNDAQTVLRPNVVTGPVTAEDVLTSDAGAVIDENNTLYIDSDNDGVIEAVQGDAIEDDEDFNTDALFQEMVDSVTVGKDIDNTVNTEEDNEAGKEYLATEVDKTASGVDLVPGYQNNAYEPVETDNEDNPFLPNGNAWIDLSKIKYGAPASPTYPFTEWSANTSFLNTSATAYDEDGRATAWTFPDVDLIDEHLWEETYYETDANTNTGDTGYVYNRYDAMQNKWGVTLDKNASMIEWDVNKTVNLSATPLLTFSTEQEDGNKLAIAVQIGTPTAWDATGTPTTYEYRWYTISDDNIHPGLSVESMNETMEPEVQISSLGADEPIINDMAYIDGALTGCIDMVHWLPFVNATTYYHNTFKVSKVRLYTQGDKPARVNYLYFLNQAAPLISVMSISADLDVNTTETSQVLANKDKTIAAARNTNGAADDQNGWVNGAALDVYNMTANNSYGGHVSTTDASKLTTYTHNNKQYLNIIIPVRKWTNVLLDSRRLAMSCALEGYTDTNGDPDWDVYNTMDRPAFSLYGNAIGGTTTQRGSNNINYTDQLLGVFGGNWSHTKNGVTTNYATPYLVGADTFNCPGKIDEDFSWNMSYAGDSNWYDLLDSHYIREHMVQSGDRYGWIYISEIHMCVPVGVEYKIGQFTFGNNSDSLNSAGIKGAFDGGTGVQPVMNVNTENGQTVSNKAAAFGPMLQTSNFGTYDLLERVSDSGDAGFYGRVFYANEAISTHWSPPNPAVVSTIPAGRYFVAYASCEYEGNTYYMVGNEKKNVVWVKKTSSNMTEQTTNGLIYEADPWVQWETEAEDILDAFANDNWMLSGFGTGWGAGDIMSKSSGVYYTTPDGNYDTDSSEEHHNSKSSAGSMYVGWDHTNKNEYQYSNTAIGVWGQGSLARTFSEPLTLQQLSGDGYNGTAPVLRYNFFISSQSAEQPMKMAMVLDIDGTFTNYHVVPDGNGGIKLSTTSESFTENMTYSGYYSFEDILNANSGKTVKLVGLAYYVKNTGYITFRNFEVLHERPEKEYKWYDEINIAKNEAGQSIVVDNVDILSDAFHYKLSDGTKALTGSGLNLIGNYGEKGWKIGSYNLDTEGSGAQTATGSAVSYPTYRPSLDHLRIPVESGNKGQFIFQADRSFPTSNFRYLYVSYSAADDDDVAAADDAGTGISMAIHGVQDSDKGYYMAVDSNEDPTALTYADRIPKDSYSSCVNAVIDLSKMSGLGSINEIVFYMNNTTSKTVDFYINYLFLSNVEPTAEYQAIAERPFYHNYYLMDGSGDRYSCRFPTTANYTGRISDATNGNEASRVNPLIIERGDIFYEGTFYNGVPLAQVMNEDGTANTSYGTATNEALSAVWFYNYNHEDLNEPWGVNDFYKISDETITFKSDLTGGNVTYDALWNYNRWLTGWGLQRYIGYDAKAQTVTGTLMELYATNNNVLLRTGIEPIKYQTIYDTQGGQMTYPGSADINDTTDGLIENENNYYITETVVLSYYKWPTEMNKPNVVVNPVKYGYIFDGWYDQKSGGTRIYRYNTKQEPGANYLYAQWIKDEEFDDVVNTVTFTTIDAKTKWFTRAANRDHEFEITIPTLTQISDGNGGKTNLTGWKIKDDTSGKVYTPGMKLTVTKDITLVPYTDSDSDVTVSITLVDAELYLYKGTTEEPTPITNGLMGIKVDGYTYSNIPRYTVLVAKPITPSESKTWQINDTSGKAYMTRKEDYGTTICTEVSTNYKQYTFAANETMTLSYATALTNRLNENNAIIWTAPKAYVKDRQMMFYTQFELPEGAQVITCGTLYTKNTQVANLLHWGDTDADKSKAFHYAMVFRKGTTVETNSTGVRFTQASITNATNQYYFMVTENKGNAVTYYARGYVHYQLGDYSYIAYSDVVSTASVPAL